MLLRSTKVSAKERRCKFTLQIIAQPALPLVSLAKRSSVIVFGMIIIYYKATRTWSLLMADDEMCRGGKC